LKRSLALIILIQLTMVNLVTLCPFLNQAQAQATTELYVNPASYTANRVNETFNVTVNIRNVETSQNLATVQFRLQYNDTLLEATDVYEGSFLQQFNNSPAPPYTLFISYVESTIDDPIYGPDVLVGIVLLPTGTPTGGVWTNYPHGNGTLATITFKTLYRPVEPSPSSTCPLNLTDTLLLGAPPDSQSITEIAHVVRSATYYAESIHVPKISLHPSYYQAVLIGEMFNISVNIDNVDVDWRLAFAQFRLQYNASVLEVVEMNEGNFLQQFPNSASAPYTFFISYDETPADDPIFGPDVLIGILLLPNGTGQWTNFPEGNGTLATITFKAIEQTAEPQPPAASALTLNDTHLFEDNSDEIPLTLQNANYQIQPLAFSYEPSTPAAGHTLLFNTASANDAVTYSWDFGDGTMLNTTESTTGHIYASPGNYQATLTCIADGISSAVATQTITVIPNNVPAPIDVTVDVGSIHFKGETAQFNILTASNGEAVNTTKIVATLYHDGTLVSDLSSSTRQAATGYYTIPYDVPATAQPGTYTLVVKAEYYNAEGTSLKSFQVNPTLTAWNDQIAQITAIQNGVATVQNGVTNLSLNLTEINATLTGLEVSNGQVLATINSTVGLLTSKLDTINAKLGDFSGNTVTVFSTLGNITTKLDGIQTTATTTLYAASVLSAIAVVLAAAILLILRKK
jgi:hypothetical protein